MISHQCKTVSTIEAQQDFNLLRLSDFACYERPIQTPDYHLGSRAFVLQCQWRLAQVWHPNALVFVTRIRSSSSSFGRSSSSYSRHTTNSFSGGADRDAHGHIKRSTASKDAFKHEHPCPSTGRSSGSCPGYVIDHVVPFKRYGEDASSNMQWQTVEAAKAKDKIE